MTPEKPIPEDCAAPRAGKPWYCHIPLIDDVIESWNKHPVAFVCTCVVLVFGAVLGTWSLWANYEDTFAKRYEAEQAAIEKQQDAAAQAQRDAQRDAQIAGGFDRVRGDMSRVAEDITDTAVGVSTVGAKVDTVLSRIEQGNEATAQLNEHFERLAASGQVLVSLPAEKLAMLRRLDQPRLELRRYDGESLLAFDDAAPEFEPGQYVNVRMYDPADTAPLHKYLLVIKGTGDVEMYTEDDVKGVRGDWQIEKGYDNETLLVVAADHELTGEERTRLVSTLEDVLPPEPLPLRRNTIYDWRDGELLQIARAHQTRDLKRNPQAPADWTLDVMDKLVAQNYAFQGYTYPINSESP